MIKQSPLNVVLMLTSLVVTLLVFALGELLLAFLAGLPNIIQCAIYLTFVTVLVFIGIFLSEKIHSGNYILKWRDEFGSTWGKAAGIMIPIGLVLGLLTQLLFGFLYTQPRIQTTIIPEGEVSGTIIELIDAMDISGNELDFVFAVDTTGSMGAYIDEVKADVVNIIGTINNQTENFRVALIDYRDFPDMSFYEFDYPAMLQLDFTNDGDDITEAIHALDLGHGGDEPETLYSALIMAVELDWRARAEKHVIVLADAPPLDPEPFTGYTMDSVSDALVGEGIQLHLIGVGGSPSMTEYFQDLADLTDGTFSNLGPASPSAGPVLSLEERTVIQESAAWWENPHLLLPFDGAGERSVPRIAVHASLLALWGIFTGLAAALALNNNKLYKVFLVPRIFVSIVISAIFAVMMASADMSLGRPGRGLLALGLCLLFMPTYNWGQDPQFNTAPGGRHSGQQY